MTDEQKKIAAAIALAVVCLTSLGLIVLGAMAAMGVLKGDSPPGSNFVAILVSMNGAKQIFGPIGVILTTGLAIAGASAAHRSMTRSAIAMVLTAMLACLVLYLAIANYSIAGPIWGRSTYETLQTYEALQEANAGFLTWVVSALSLALASLLGISIARKSKS